MLRNPQAPERNLLRWKEDAADRKAFETRLTVKIKSWARKHTITIVILLLISAGGYWFLPQSQPHRVITIATGTRGGTYHPLGRQIAHVLRELSHDPIRVEAVLETSGSVDNLQRLTAPRNGRDSANLAFVQYTALAKAAPAVRDAIRAIAVLYDDVVQVIVCGDLEMPKDLRGKRIYLGKDGSGAKLVAEALLKAAGVAADQYIRVGADAGFGEAADLMIAGRADVGLFFSGMPTPAVTEAAKAGNCRLVNVNITPEQMGETTPEFDGVFGARTIPANFYEGQRTPVETLGAPTVLAVRRDLDDDLVQSILDTLFDNIHELLLVHTGAQEIRFQDAYSASLPADVAWHPGAQRFWEEEQEKLLITTGAITGLYYDVGKTMELLLEQSGIPARAIHTEGSVSNAFLLRDPRWKTLAFMQYDTALSAYLGSAGPVYGQGFTRELQVTDSNGDPLRVEGMRRIAAFQEEKVHFLIRSEKLDGQFTDRNPKLEALRGLRVSLGPRNSGTRLLARAILLHHGLSLDSIEEVYLSGPEMVAQLSAGDIDGAVMVEAVPSQILLTALENDGIRLLSVDRGKLAKIISGAALTVTKIEPGTYGCQPPGAPAVDTVATRTVLVTAEDTELDVSKITRVLFQGAAFLGVKDGGASMAVELPSLPLHS